MKRDLYESASEQLYQQLEAREALELRTKKETQGKEEIKEQADLVAENNDWEEAGGDSSSVLSVKSAFILCIISSSKLISQDQTTRRTTGRENANEPKLIFLRDQMAAN